MEETNTIEAAAISEVAVVEKEDFVEEETACIEDIESSNGCAPVEKVILVKEFVSIEGTTSQDDMISFEDTRSLLVNEEDAHIADAVAIEETTKVADAVTVK